MNRKEIEICGCPCELDPWELIRWIVIKHLEGTALHAEATCYGTRISGELHPHSIDRTQHELTRSTLVDIHTPDGTVTCNCKHLTKITLLHP